LAARFGCDAERVANGLAEVQAAEIWVGTPTPPDHGGFRARRASSCDGGRGGPPPTAARGRAADWCGWPTCLPVALVRRAARDASTAGGAAAGAWNSSSAGLDLSPEPTAAPCLARLFGNACCYEVGRGGGWPRKFSGTMPRAVGTTPACFSHQRGGQQKLLWPARRVTKIELFPASDQTAPPDLLFFSHQPPHRAATNGVPGPLQAGLSAHMNAPFFTAGPAAPEAHPRTPPTVREPIRPPLGRETRGTWRFLAADSKYVSADEPAGRWHEVGIEAGGGERAQDLLRQARAAMRATSTWDSSAPPYRAARSRTSRGGAVFDSTRCVEVGACGQPREVTRPPGGADRGRRGG